MSKPSSADPLFIHAKQIAPLVPQSVVAALINAANETAKHQAASGCALFLHAPPSLHHHHQP